jgi:CDP-glucose 4,6-dehydratase
LVLECLGAKVSGFSLAPPTTPSLFEMAGLGETTHTVRGDVREPLAVDAAVIAARPEIVLHLAAQPLVRASYADPVGTFATNVMGTLHVLDAVRRIGGVRAVVNVTTDKCYENREWVWGYREDEPMGGHDPYSASKGCSELATAAMRRSFFAQAGSAAVATARAGNVIGGGDWAADRLLPDCIRAMREKRPVLVRSPDSIRPWQHVLEPIHGYLALARRLCDEGPRFAEGWNFGPADEDARPVRWIADRMTSLWGDGASWRAEGGSHPHEANHLKLDTSKARARLGWRPRLDLAAALEWTVAWFKAVDSGKPARQVCLDQINRHIAMKTPAS